MDPYKAGAILGDAIGTRGAPGVYEEQVRRVGQAESAMQGAFRATEEARRARSLALIDAARLASRQNVTADRFQRAMSGDPVAQAELNVGILGSNTHMTLGDVGNFARPFYGQNTNAAQEALTLGDIPTYNKMTAAAAGKDYQPVRELGGAYIADGATLGDLGDMVPTLGTQSRMATDRAQQANSYASAARTRQAAAIDAGQFALERAGQWNPSGKSSGGGGGGKALSAPVVMQLTKDAAKLQNLTGLAASFKDDFAGSPMMGDFENQLGRLGWTGGMTGATKGQAEWWQQYDRYKNEVRNELFGAALTETEQRAFEQADINPGMSPTVLKTNLEKQRGIIQEGLQRKGRVWAAQGYNPDAIMEATGLEIRPQSAPTLGDPPAPAAPVRIQSAEDYNRLPSGTLFIAPDGTQRRKK